MKRIRKLILTMMLVWAGNILAQTNNLWPAYESNKAYKQSAYYFDEVGNFKFIPHLTNAPVDTLRHETFSIPYTSSNWGGTATLYSDRFHFFVNGIRIGNSDVYIPETDENVFIEGFARPIIAPCDTANFMFIRSFTKRFTADHITNNTDSGFVSYVYIRKDTNHVSGYSIPQGESNKRIEYSDEAVMGCATTRNINGQLILVVRTTNNLYSYEWNPISMTFVSLDSIHIPFLTLSSNPLYSDISMFKVYKLISMSEPVLSSKGDKLAFAINYEVSTVTGRKAVEIVSAILQFDFDRNTGKFKNLKPIYSHQWNISHGQPPAPDFFVSWYIQYSPNGDFIYLRGVNALYNFDNLNKPILNSYSLSNPSFHPFSLGNSVLMSVNNIGEDKKVISQDSFYYSDPIHLNHLGELVIIQRGAQSNSFVISRIKKPNLAPPNHEYVANTDQFPNGFRPDNAQSLMYDFNRISYTIDYTCSASVRFKNNPDPSINFNSFKWHLVDEEGNPYILTDQNPVLNFTKNGDYPFLLLSQSEDGSGYGEWYVDTLRIRIPEKPVASFLASDTVICKFADVFFNNQSHAKDSITNTFTWHFGDGVTSNQFSPKHQYTQTGVYTVSLFYSNGYCDSTLVKNQYIQVLDAPKPGIDITPLSGCTPLLITITDTQTVSVIKKRYYFSDTKLWQEEVNPVVSHVFNETGEHMVIEHLEGYSGCMVLDTAYIQAMHGLTEIDSFSVLNATIDENMALVYWHGNEGAIAYTLFKQAENGNPIRWKTTSDTFYTDDNYKPGERYFINGVDTCGGSGIRSRPGKPVVLTGVMLGINESAQLNFTNYESWEGSIRYDLQKWMNESWTFISQSNNSNSFADPNFAEDDTLTACYRIVAHHPGQPNIKSLSNVFCLDLAPQIWVPNAFTPNRNGLNDQFYPVLVGIQTFEMQIYNRWGEKIFEGTNTPWDGTTKNTLAPEGVYVLMYRATTTNGSIISNKGIVQLLR